MDPKRGKPCDIYIYIYVIGIYYNTFIQYAKCREHQQYQQWQINSKKIWVSFRVMYIIIYSDRSRCINDRDAHISIPTIVFINVCTHTHTYAHIFLVTIKGNSSYKRYAQMTKNIMCGWLCGTQWVAEFWLVLAMWVVLVILGGTNHLQYP